VLLAFVVVDGLVVVMLDLEGVLVLRPVVVVAFSVVVVQIVVVLYRFCRPGFSVMVEAGSG
jgi:hypothetical protein